MESLHEKIEEKQRLSLRVEKKKESGKEKKI